VNDISGSEMKQKSRHVCTNDVIDVLCVSMTVAGPSWKTVPDCLIVRWCVVGTECTENEDRKSEDIIVFVVVEWHFAWWKR